MASFVQDNESCDCRHGVRPISPAEAAPELQKKQTKNKNYQDPTKNKKPKKNTEKKNKNNKSARVRDSQHTDDATSMAQKSGEPSGGLP